jgi:uncharacterized protein with HEPN domain
MNNDTELIQTLHSAAGRLLSRADGEIGTTVSCLLTIADAAGAISPQFRRCHPDIPWSVLAEMGAVLHRAGDDLNPHEVAATMQRDIPELHRRLTAL